MKSYEGVGFRSTITEGEVTPPRERPPAYPAAKGGHLVEDRLRGFANHDALLIEILPVSFL
jgi:hypothetical protein